VTRAAATETENPFLGPIMRRWRSDPSARFGVFHDGDDWNVATLDDVIRRALRFSSAFADVGVGQGDIVLLIIQHGIDAYAAFLGVMLIGAVPSFMPYPSVKQDAVVYWKQHRQVFAHIRPRAILVYDTLLAAVMEAVEDADIAVLAQSRADDFESLRPGALPSADTVALLQHSSGTTGLKKGVMLSYRAIVGHLEAYGRALGLDAVASPAIASWLPLYHDMGLVTSFLLPVWSGAPILAIDPFEWTRRPTLLFEAIETFAATHAWVPNFSLVHQVRSVRSELTWDLSSLQALICCSEPCKPESFDLFSDRFSSWGLGATVLRTCYAMAETVFAVTQSPLGQVPRRLRVDRLGLQTQAVAVAAQAVGDTVELLSNGPPVAGCRVEIRREGKAVVDGVVGEVCVTAPWMFSGYHHNPTATENALDGGWLKTGDLGFVDGSEVYIVGRLKDVIIVNGKNLFAHDVEAAVSRVAGVKPGRAVAFGWYDASVGSEQLVVVAERDEPADEDAAVIRRLNHAVSTEVGVGCGDVRLVEHGWLLKTTSGKISRSENVGKYQRAFLGLGADNAPAGG
jgi:fatty-acyl-CoA synthase